jgi:hypothetical protein
VTINVIPDEVLLEAFHFYVYQALDEDAWHTLVHVCRRWRCVVFASPQRLNMRLLCTQKRLSKALDVWPSLPIIISCGGPQAALFGHDVDAIIAALKHRDRICRIDIRNVPSRLWEIFSTNEVPYPALTSLKLHSRAENLPVLPDSFWGGSAPLLQGVVFSGIPFMALGKVISSTSGLVDLWLSQIPHSNRVTPDSIVSSLSTLTRLRSLTLLFQFSILGADEVLEDLHPLTRVVLPALTRLRLQGYSTYLEGIVSRIDTPLLQSFTIQSYHYHLLRLDMPLLLQFINRTKAFEVLHQADVVFGSAGVLVKFLSPNGMAPLTLEILLGEGARQLPALVQVWRSSLPPFPTLERVNIREFQAKRGHWKGNAETMRTQWMDLFLHFSSVRDVGLYGRLIPHVVAALVQGLAGSGETVPVVLPALQNLFVEGLRLSRPAKKAIGQFIAMQKPNGRVAVHYTNEEVRQHCILDIL